MLPITVNMLHARTACFTWQETYEVGYFWIVDKSKQHSYIQVDKINVGYTRYVVHELDEISTPLLIGYEMINAPKQTRLWIHFCPFVHKIYWRQKLENFLNIYVFIVYKRSQMFRDDVFIVTKHGAWHKKFNLYINTITFHVCLSCLVRCLINNGEYDIQPKLFYVYLHRPSTFWEFYKLAWTLFSYWHILNKPRIFKFNPQSII